MLWVDPTDPEVFAAVSGVELGEEPADPDLQLEVNRAVAIASELLTLATGQLIHPAGTRTEEFIGRGTKRFAPVFGPVIEVVSLVRVAADDTERPMTHRLVGNTVYLTGAAGGDTGSVPLWRTNWAPSGSTQVHRLTYRYASTLTATARAMALHYAAQFFAWLTGADDCELPDNVTSIDREGLGIQLATPQDFLDRGRTGIAKIDTWLAQVNAKRALRPSAVYTPDSPPGVAVRRQ